MHKCRFEIIVSLNLFCVFRDQGSRRNHWQSKDYKTSSNPNDDLRSPCHKHPRFKAQQVSTPTDKLRSKEPWNKMVDSNQEQTQKTVLGNKDFPPLGFNIER